MHTSQIRPALLRLTSVVSLLAILLSGCSLSLLNLPGITQTSTVTPTSEGPAPTAQPAAAISFRVNLPSPLLAGETLYLSIVDEVTGLSLNPVNYAMQGMDPLDYTVTLPFPLNSVVKYRYIRQAGLPVAEDDPLDRPVRYRMYTVTGPGTVNDVVAAWTDSPFSGSFGQVSGTLVDAATQTPLPNILVAVGGQQTLTDSKGFFIFPAMQVGTHNLVVYSLDGAYQTFQQGATVAADQTTPVKIAMTAATMVNVIFNMTAPPETISNAPIRLAGNLYQLGNSFGDLQGGLSTVAARMPVLTQGLGGHYTLSLMLPAGADIRYKYTLGDGFWNAEHNTDGSFILHQLIVPNSSTPVEVDDVSPTWQAGTSSPILFEVTAPAITPVTDIVSIQFNPYGWTEPIPMWSRGNNQWVYELYSPLNMLGNFEYRYCRDDQCGTADDAATSTNTSGRLVSTSLTPQDFQDTITDWTFLQASGPSSLVGVPVTARTNFTAGVEFHPGYDPTWQSWLPLAIQNIQGIYANWLVMPSTWTVQRTAPLLFSPTAGSDALWSDMLNTISLARAANLSVAVFPQPKLTTDPVTWWTQAPRDAAWWESWFQRYTAFVDYNADLATKSGAQALILGGDWVLPALPGGQVDNAPSGVPADAEVRWQAILADIRYRYKGSVYWALDYPGGLASAPDFVKNLDGVYVLWYAPLTGTDVESMKTSAGQLLDTDLKPFQSTILKPVILAVAYPSTDAAADASLTMTALFQPAAPRVAVNLQAQADVYQAVLEAVNERAWVGGFVSRGYYPPVVLQDASASIHGKLTADELWYWYARFLGLAQ